jgi:hypothetical protein
MFSPLIFFLDFQFFLICSGFFLGNITNNNKKEKKKTLHQRCAFFFAFKGNKVNQL